MPRDNPNVSIIIPIYNKWCLTRDCLDLLRAKVPGDYYEIIVIDNGSSDETPSECPGLGMALYGERFRFVQPGENLGFARGSNLGAQEARGEYLLFLNNDTYPDNDFLPLLVDQLRTDDRLGAVGPLLLYPAADAQSARVQHLGVALADRLKFLHLYHLFPARHRVVRRKRRFQVITAACMLMRKDVFLQHGMFHEGYVNGYEDVDLCLQITRKGQDCMVLPEAVVYHYASQSSGRYEQEARNFECLSRRWSNSIVPDMHVFAREDEYELRFTRWLEPYIALPAAADARLRERMRAAKDMACIVELLDEEPCWDFGYEVLAQTLEDAGEWREAVNTRWRQCSFVPSVESLKSLLRDASRCGDTQRQTGTRDFLSGIATILAQPEGLILKARAAMAKHMREGRPALSKAYADWLARYSQA